MDPLTLFIKANRRLAINQNLKNISNPRFGHRISTVQYRIFAHTLRTCCQVMHQIAPVRYTDADPIKIIECDPNSINYVSNRPNREFGSVVSGDWDQDIDTIEDDESYMSVKIHFENGVPWEETPLFKSIRNAVASEDCTTWPLERYVDRFKRVDEIYSRIRNEGYKSQRTLFAEDPSRIHQQNNDGIHPYLNEVGVDIDREGNLLWRSRGRHRLYLSKILDIPQVPVLVWSRHTEWQKIRNKLRDRNSKNSKIFAEFRGHPDLGDILPYK